MKFKSIMKFQKLYLVILFVVAITILSPLASGECANACSGHGQCTLFDMCICQRNWQSSDCSESELYIWIEFKFINRNISLHLLFIGVCLFGRAYFDTPIGDLNGDGKISGPETVLLQNSFSYPYGTTEYFPQDSLDNSAHRYTECSTAVL